MQISLFNTHIIPMQRKTILNQISFLTNCLGDAKELGNQMGPRNAGAEEAAEKLRQ